MTVKVNMPSTVRAQFVGDALVDALRQHVMEPIDRMTMDSISACFSSVEGCRAVQIEPLYLDNGVVGMQGIFAFKDGDCFLFRVLADDVSIKHYGFLFI